VSAIDGILLIILAGLAGYALLGGADFGGGVWDLLARGPRKRRQRDLIATAIGPVWEANHVWLIFVIIALFSGFPIAFGALARGLHLPLALALVGIVLRGAAFVFRQYGDGDPDSRPVAGTRLWGRVFAVASTLTPVMLGVCGAAVATGRISTQPTLAIFHGWFTIIVGALTLVICAYLSAVYLCHEAHHRGHPDLADDFRRYALGAAVAAGALALAALPALRHDAPTVWDRLFADGWPALGLSAAGGFASIAALTARRYLAARVAAAGATLGVLAGWALAQYPYLIPPPPDGSAPDGVADLTAADAAAPAATLPITLGVLLIGFALTIPALLLLFRMTSPSPPRQDGTAHETRQNRP